MASLNKVMIIGNLGSDPEVRHLDGGSVVARFNVATTERYTNKAGEKMESTEWHKIEVWDKQAEVAEKYLKKGDSVHIEGKIKSETYVDKKDNVEKTVIRVRATSLIMLSSKSDKGANTPAPAEAPAKANQTVQSSAKPATAAAKPAARPAAAHPAGFENGGDDDLPF